MTALLERDDFTDFRHIDGLVARGGVSADRLRGLVAKELLDNAADELDRVGSDAVPTLSIDAADGTTDVTWEAVDHPAGTRVAVWLDPAVLPPVTDRDWLAPAVWLFGGERFPGRSSPHWFDGPAFFEYLQSVAGISVRAAVPTWRAAPGQRRSLTNAGRARRRTFRRRGGGAAGALPGSRSSRCAGTPQSRSGAENGRSGDYGLPAMPWPWLRSPRRRPAQPRRPSRCWLKRGPAPPTRRDAVVRQPLPKHGARPFQYICRARTTQVAGCGSVSGRWPVVKTKRRSPAEVLVNVTAPHLPRTSDGKAPDLSRLREPLGGTLTRVLATVERAWPSPKNRSRRRVRQYGRRSRRRRPMKTRCGSNCCQHCGGLRFRRRRYTKRELYYHLRS